MSYIVNLEEVDARSDGVTHKRQFKKMRKQGSRFPPTRELQPMDCFVDLTVSLQ